MTKPMWLEAPISLPMGWFWGASNLSGGRSRDCFSWFTKITQGFVYNWRSDSKCSFCAGMRTQSLKRFWGKCRAQVTLWSEQTELLWYLNRITQISLPVLHQRPFTLTYFPGRWGLSSLGSTRSSHPLSGHRYKCHCHRHILWGRYRHHCHTSQGSPAALLPFHWLLCS